MGELSGHSLQQALGFTRHGLATLRPTCTWSLTRIWWSPLIRSMASLTETAGYRAQKPVAFHPYAMPHRCLIVAYHILIMHRLHQVASGILMHIPLAWRPVMADEHATWLIPFWYVMGITIITQRTENDCSCQLTILDVLDKFAVNL